MAVRNETPLLLLLLLQAHQKRNGCSITAIFSITANLWSYCFVNYLITDNSLEHNSNNPHRSVAPAIILFHPQSQSCSFACIISVNDNSETTPSICTNGTRLFKPNGGRALSELFDRDPDLSRSSAPFVS